MRKNDAERFSPPLLTCRLEVTACEKTQILSGAFFSSTSQNERDPGHTLTAVLRDAGAPVHCVEPVDGKAFGAPAWAHLLRGHRGRARRGPAGWSSRTAPEASGVRPLPPSSPPYLVTSAEPPVGCSPTGTQSKRNCAKETVRWLPPDGDALASPTPSFL